MAAISTAHITAGDDKLLRHLVEDRTESSGADVHEWREVALDAGYAIPIEGGWLLRIYEDGAEQEDQMVQDAGFSEAFVGLITFWRKRSVGWVRLDRDACTIKSLPAFEW